MFGLAPHEILTRRSESLVGDERETGIAPMLRWAVVVPLPIAESLSKQLVARTHVAREDDVAAEAAMAGDAFVGEERRERHRAIRVHRHLGETRGRWLTAGDDRDVLVRRKAGHDDRNSRAPGRIQH